MFPTGSPLHYVVANCYGNGLKALKAILQRSYPAFVDEPSTLVQTLRFENYDLLCVTLSTLRLRTEDRLPRHTLPS